MVDSSNFVQMTGHVGISLIISLHSFFGFHILLWAAAISVEKSQRWPLISKTYLSFRTLGLSDYTELEN